MSELLPKHLLADLETTNPKKRIKEIRQEKKEEVPSIPSLAAALGAAGALGSLAAMQQQGLAQSAMQVQMQQQELALRQQAGIQQMPFGFFRPT